MKTRNKLILAVYGCPGCATPSLHSFLHALPKWLEVNLFLAALAAWIHLFITFDGMSFGTKQSKNYGFFLGQVMAKKSKTLITLKFFFLITTDFASL